MPDNRSLMGWFGDRKYQGLLKHVSATHLFNFFFFFFSFFSLISFLTASFLFSPREENDRNRRRKRRLYRSTRRLLRLRRDKKDWNPPRTTTLSVLISSVLSCFLRRKKGLKSITIDASLVPHRDSSVLFPLLRDSSVLYPLLRDSSILSSHSDPTTVDDELGLDCASSIISFLLC